MAEAQKPEPVTEAPGSIGLYSRPEWSRGFTTADVIAAAVSVVWLLLVGGFFLFAGTGDGSGGALTSIMTIVAVVLPVALIWIAAVTLRTAQTMRAESERLQAAIDSMRNAYLNQVQTGGTKSSVEKRLDEIAASARQAESAIASFAASARQGGPILPPAAQPKAALAVAARATGNEQPALALGTADEAQRDPISIEEFIRAMNFPDSPSDREGFRALKRALEDHGVAKLIRAAQDALTLLSQDGIYMDDLRPDRARPDIWRRFAQGERGKPISALGGVRDRSSLALTAARMRQDTIFRDTVHHFLRLFDKTFAEFETNASDSDIVALSETRTARAFMLLGRVTGIFD